MRKHFPFFFSSPITLASRALHSHRKCLTLHFVLLKKCITLDSMCVRSRGGGGRVHACQACVQTPRQKYYIITTLQNFPHHTYNIHLVAGHFPFTLWRPPYGPQHAASEINARRVIFLLVPITLSIVTYVAHSFLFLWEIAHHNSFLACLHDKFQGYWDATQEVTSHHTK